MRADPLDAATFAAEMTTELPTTEGANPACGSTGERANLPGRVGPSVTTRPGSFSLWWSPDRIEQLTKLHANSGLSFGAISRIMGASKNVVIGKAHRLGLPLRPIDPSFNRYPRKPSLKEITAAGQEYVGCRFISGDPHDKNWSFCQKNTVKFLTGYPSPYCAEHHKLCYKKHVAPPARAIDPQAFVALEAMKNPTEKMLAASNFSDERSREIFNAMIQAALGED